MEQDIEKLKAEMESKAKEGFELAPFFQHSLSNFAHRYFDSASAVTEYSEGNFLVSGIESKLKNALKSKSKTIQNGIKELAKNVPYREGPSVKYELGIEVLSFDRTRGGSIKAYAEVNWNFPSFEKDKSKLSRKEEVLNFEDSLILRNKLAKTLESVCEGFPS